MPAHKILIEWTGIAGSPYLSTFFIDVSIVPDPADAADAVLGNLSPLQSVLTDPLSFNYIPEVTTYSVPSVPMGTNVVPPGPVQNMTAPGDQLPHATQGLIKWDSGVYVGARRIKGKTFIPGFVESYSGPDGRPTQQALDSMNGVAAAMITDGLMIASRKNDQFYRVQTATAWSEWAVLRSRRD